MLGQMDTLRDNKPQIERTSFVRQRTRPISFIERAMGRIDQQKARCGQVLRICLKISGSLIFLSVYLTPIAHYIQ